MQSLPRIHLKCVNGQDTYTEEFGQDRTEPTYVRPNSAYVVVHQRWKDRDGTIVAALESADVIPGRETCTQTFPRANFTYKNAHVRYLVLNPERFSGKVHVFGRGNDAVRENHAFSVVRAGTKVLLVQQKNLAQRVQHMKLWGLPGGYVDWTDQSAQHAAARELAEELKYTLCPPLACSPPGIPRVADLKTRSAFRYTTLNHEVVKLEEAPGGQALRFPFVEACFVAEYEVADRNADQAINAITSKFREREDMLKDRPECNEIEQVMFVDELDVLERRDIKLEHLWAIACSCAQRYAFAAWESVVHEYEAASTVQEQQRWLTNKTLLVEHLRRVGARVRPRRT